MSSRGGTTSQPALSRYPENVFARAFKDVYFTIQLFCALQSFWLSSMPLIIWSMVSLAGSAAREGALWLQ